MVSEDEWSLLDNAVWWSLEARHQHLGEVVGRARRYRTDISVFSALDTFDDASWGDLAKLIGSAGTGALFRGDIPDDLPPEWRVKIRGVGRQMTLKEVGLGGVEDVPIRRLTSADVGQMLDLVALTKPGPFLPATIELGSYFGYFEDDLLTAMAGERLRPEGFTEISAVCTHPDAQGRGLASTLTHHVATNILERGEQPFLHVASTNESARRVYERLGFDQRRLVDMAVVQPALAFTAEKGRGPTADRRQ